jgi:hypothetical protein
MRTLVSGQAGVAVRIDGSHCAAVRLGSPREIPCSPRDLAYLFGDAADIEETTLRLEVAVDRQWRQDRGLHLILILLDSAAEPEARREAAECLEELLAAGNVHRFVHTRMYVAPLPPNADPSGARALAGSSATRILEDVIARQAGIARARAAWDSLPDSFLGGPDGKRRFAQALVNYGAFYLLAHVGSADKEFWIRRLADRFKLDAAFRASIVQDVLAEWVERFAASNFTAR